ncbi:MAG: phosphatase PAP2 family protein [Chloroherpetonaceae bacterium]|nr:phosphatase PAP2 family protein [Chloroherpetonaceae bacterium]
MELLYQFDVWLFRWVNEGFGQPYLDSVMLFVTDFKRSWVIAALAAGYLIVTRKRESVLPIVLSMLAVAIADQTASGLLKPLVQRARPCFELENVRLLLDQTRSFSFASSHAANAAAVATVAWLFCANSGRVDRLFAFALIGFAFLSGYSRVYVGVHYPLDVLAGWGIGVASGALVYLSVSFVWKNYLWSKKQLQAAGKPASPHKQL